MHIHGDERNALKVAKELQRERCANLIHLDGSERHVRFEDERGTCVADPNRMFSERGLSELGVAESDAMVLAGAKNPAINERELANFVLVTQAADFHALRARRNVFLEASKPADDGSLSVLLSGDRYFNVEARDRRKRKGYRAGKALPNDVLDVLRVPLRREGCRAGR